MKLDEVLNRINLENPQPAQPNNPNWAELIDLIKI
jgi:hypothetical protein